VLLPEPDWPEEEPYCWPDPDVPDEEPWPDEAVSLSEEVELPVPELPLAVEPVDGEVVDPVVLPLPLVPLLPEEVLGVVMVVSLDEVPLLLDCA
jgi:hypothetical protein